MDSKLTLLLASSCPETLFDLLAHYRVVIPAIQRHYVQGANTPRAKEVRNGFLQDLFRHFSEQPDEPFKLDYIFGPIRTEGDDAFVPVDGQQRLTTLWLLARYAAEKVSNAEHRLGILRLLARFTYEGRIYARRFCAAITRQDSAKWWGDPTQGQTCTRPSIVLYRLGLLNQGWMVDSTVSAMIVMLDSIHESWMNSSKQGGIVAEKFIEFLWTQVRFELCHDQFADDIYMKMNARGLALTQWENAKGQLSKWINNPEENWNKPIERYSDLFFSLFEDPEKENAEAVLPDEPFLALLGRICAYENPLQATQCPDIILLAHAKLPGKIPYVPFSSFETILSKEARQKVLKGFLRLLKFFVVPKNEIIESPDWWAVTKGVSERIFYPQNDNDRDFSLLFYEYAKQFPDEEISSQTLADVARLFGNLLENVARDNGAPQTRIQQIIDCFLKQGEPNPYLSEIAADETWSSKPLAYLEEAAKARLYKENNLHCIKQLRYIEEALHGRCRLAVLDIPSRKIADRIVCEQRLEQLASFCERWEKGDESFRRGKIGQIARAMPLALRAQFNYSLERDALWNIFCNLNDQDLQSKLFPSPKKETPPVQLAESLKPWQRDWREVLHHLATREEDFQPTDNNRREHYVGGTVRWTHGGCYLIRRGYQNITGAFPLSDWRSDLQLRTSSECWTVLRKIAGFSSVRTNDSNTRSEWRNDEYIVYLCETGIDIRQIKDRAIVKSWKINQNIEIQEFLQRVLRELQDLDSSVLSTQADKTSSS